MPIYEYRCDNCQRKVEVYQPTFNALPGPCEHCNSDALKRVFSTFSVYKTDTDIYDNILNDSDLVKGMSRNDPQALAKWNNKMSRGEKVGPEHEELLGKLERGQMPTTTKKE
ncbi:zinc ribbon domain-containing protein [Chloroflexota bacterium]